ncbi:hypothetical protein BU14_0298s0002 [Porphyra umbilicalis]|uniref:Uncharacterized protein n=1 Tax=Porphyra umbilicalis TaxID=2786 RepID=A0A1X6P064_PORUM|nr:hypothetical protein BU14_0298s0002 [Porphyra umbilicalis]|eukprot:OSX74258.1 hypothetical protein BU14_0298s0002 [Porphyra umbilicalis]
MARAWAGGRRPRGSPLRLHRRRGGAVRRGAAAACGRRGRRGRLPRPATDAADWQARTSGCGVPGGGRRSVGGSQRRVPLVAAAVPPPPPRVREDPWRLLDGRRCRHVHLCPPASAGGASGAAIGRAPEAASRPRH